MDIHPARTSRHRVLRNGVLNLTTLGLGVLLAGCWQTAGDFGRAPSGVFEASVLPFAGSFAARLRGEPVSLYALTEDEKELRARAWHFLMPETDAPALTRRQDQLSYHRVLPAREFDVTLYHRTIMGGPHFGTLVGDSPRIRAIFGAGHFASLTSRYNRVRDSITADHALVPHFRLLAMEVVQADQVRARGLTHIANLTDEQRSEALARTCENAQIIARVNWAYSDRAAMYRYSLEHLLVEGPEREAMLAERTLMAFEADIARLRGDAPEAQKCSDPVPLPPRIEPRPLVRKG